MYCMYSWCKHQHERCARLHENPATRNRTRDHLIAATLDSQMLYQLSYSRSDCMLLLLEAIPPDMASIIRSHVHAHFYDMEE